MIESLSKPLHSNYFLALESELADVTRYIEFSKDNFNTYSLELCHILLSASSDVDVVAKALCKRVAPKCRVRSIDKYREILKPAYPHICTMKVEIPRYGLRLSPWISWQHDRSPKWWGAYNDVKHERNANFNKANLQNTLNAVAGLLVSVIYLYQKEAEKGLLEPLKVFRLSIHQFAITSKRIPGMRGIGYEFP